MNMIRKNFHLSMQQITALKSIASKKGIAVAELVRRIIDKYLDKFC